MAMLYNDKILDCISLCLRARFLALEGSARSGKTASISADGLYYAVKYNSEDNHIISARDFDAIKNNILEMSVTGLLKAHPDCKLRKASIGGYYVSLMGKDKREKKIFLVNYSNKSSWEKILGNTLGVVYIDEVNIADKQFVLESLARQISADKPLTIVTTNGDDPNHWIYQDYINYCKILGKVPASIVKEMTEFQSKHNGYKEGYYYLHWTMDDNPILTPEKKKSAMSIYKEGSYYYNTKILGIRGIQNELIFESVMDENLIQDAFEVDDHGRRLHQFTNYTFGLDTGGGRAFNSICLTGYEKNFSRAMVLKVKVFDETGMKNKYPIIFNFIEECFKLFQIHSSQVDGLMVDCADQNAIADLKDAIYEAFRINTVGSYKATIRERIDCVAICFSTNRLLFHTTCRKGYDAYLHAQKGDKPYERLDTNETNATGDNDVMDSIEYSITRHRKDLMRLGGNY